MRGPSTNPIIPRDMIPAKILTMRMAASIFIPLWSIRGRKKKSGSAATSGYPTKRTRRPVVVSPCANPKMAMAEWEAV